jgi:hypothetical protein
MGIFDLGRVGWDEKPLVHINDIDIKRRILLLKALGVARGLIAGSKSTPELNPELVILLRRFRANHRHACKSLTGHGRIILL